MNNQFSSMKIHKLLIIDSIPMLINLWWYYYNIVNLIKIFGTMLNFKQLYQNNIFQLP